MAEISEISWTDSTYNPWIGCTKVGPGCDHCYAEADFDKRKGIARWGNGNPRHRTKTYTDVLKWEREHEAFYLKYLRRRRVFSASLADIFDNEVDPEWRADFWNLVRATPHLDWQIVTKRISNVRRMLPPDWFSYPYLYQHVTLIVTVCNQEEVDRDVVRLLNLKKDCRWLRVGLSIEPLLGPIRFRWSLWDAPFGLDWVIVGGESGLESRPMHPAWVRDIRDECRAGKIPFHFKQWGEWVQFDPANDNHAGVENERIVIGFDGKPARDGDDGAVRMIRLGKKHTGRKLDGREYNGFPQATAA